LVVPGSNRSFDTIDNRFITEFLVSDIICDPNTLNYSIFCIVVSMIMDGLVDYKTWLPVPPLASETILRLGTASATIEFVRTEIEFDLDFFTSKD